MPYKLCPKVCWRGSRVQKKKNFRGLQGQFDVKNANFRGLIAKISHGDCSLNYVGGILEFKKLDFMGLKCQFVVKKRPILGDLQLNLAIICLFCLLDTTYEPFSLNMP